MEEEKVKGFLEEHKGKILVGAGIVAATGIYLLCDRSYRLGVRTGAIIGFQETINWYDRNFENLNLRELWNEWVIANPEKVVSL